MLLLCNELLFVVTSFSKVEQLLIFNYSFPRKQSFQSSFSSSHEQSTRGGHAQLSAIAIPQLEGGTSAIAIPQLLKKCYSATAIPQSQFFLESASSSPQLESFTSAIFGAFLAVKSGQFMKK
jgi:hypothetical protein